MTQYLQKNDVHWSQAKRENKLQKEVPKFYSLLCPSVVDCVYEVIRGIVTVSFMSLCNILTDLTKSFSKRFLFYFIGKIL